MAETLSNRAKFRERVEKICSSRDLKNILKIHKKSKHTFSRGSPIYGCEHLLIFMNQGTEPKSGRDLQNSMLPSPAPHGLASALKSYFHGFAGGQKHENCEEHIDIQLPPEWTPDRESLREHIWQMLKKRVLKRKMALLKHKKKEYFEAARVRLAISQRRRALRGSAHSEDLKRTPWQLLLHKGAPGSGLKTEFGGYDDAQLVPLPLLHIMSITTLEFRRALHRIVGLVSLPYICFKLKIVELINTCTQPMSVSYNREG